MSNKMKKFSVLMVISIIIMINMMLLTGFAPGPMQDAAPVAVDSTTRVFIDDAGREVIIPENIATIGSSGPGTQVILWSVAPDKMVNVAYPPTDVVKPFMSPEMQALPDLGQLYGRVSNLNIEGLAKLDPDIVLDIGMFTENTAAEMDNLQEQIAIPTIFIEAELDTYPDMFRKLGELLNDEEHCEQLAQYTEKVLAEIDKKAASIPAEDVVKVYYGVGTDALYTAPSTSIHSGVINRIGAKNVVDVEINTIGAGSNISMENIYNWDPDVIILTNEGHAYEMIPEDPAWQELQCVQDGKVYEIPEGPYSWFSSPPSINRLIGFQWMGNLLYPEIYDYDMISVAQDYYKLFYQFDLSEEQAKELMGKSTFKN